jgi:hypothetical protein
MPKYDAFGREIGEDTLAGLGGDPSAQPRPVTPEPADGWSEAAAAGPAAEPVAGVPGQEVPLAPPPRQQRQQPASFSIPGQIPVGGRPRRRRRGVGGFGCLFALVFAAVLVAGPVIALVAFIGDTADTIDDVRTQIEGATDDTPTPGIEEVAPPPTGIEGRSMIRPANLAAAIAELKQQKGDLGNLTLWPDRINAELVTKRDNETNYVLTYTGELREGDPVDVGIPQETVPWGRIDPAVPSRFVKAAAKRFGLKPQRIDYVIGEHDVFDDEPLRWLAYFKGGAIVQGDENGRPERRIS